MAEIVNGAGINEANAHVKKNRSRFPLKEVFCDTHRFGEYHPHFVMDGISGDKHPFRCIHDARSYTLKAPLMQDLKMNKDYFMVPLRAILPLQAERVVTHPTIGDDIPADAYTSVSNFLDKVITFANSIATAALAEYNNSNTPAFLTLHLKWMVFLESIFSNGSLMASLGCNLNSCLSITSTGAIFDPYDMDSYFDRVSGIISTELLNGDWTVTIDGVNYLLSLEEMPRGYNYFSADRISMHDFLQKIRDTSDWSFVSTGGFVETNDPEFDHNDVFLDYNSQADFPLDLARLWAYHLVVAEYFSNDKIDYIYSADLFRQYIFSLLVRTHGGLSSFQEQFSWNGVTLMYDYLCARFLNLLITFNYGSLSSPVAHLQYFLTLFGYARSLRFKDYFTGSRTRPLAVVTSRANTDVPVVGGNVSVIDVTRSIQVQRFLNAVNAAGRKYGEYIDALFGVRPNKDMHEPIFLAHSSDSLFASEVENTGAAQQTQANSVTAIFRGNSNNFEYSVPVDEPCIIIGVTSYDIERLYPDTIQRSWFIRDRFDMFIPEMQYIGDQQVYQHELCAGFDTAFGAAFGYQFRDMQWKQLFPRCAGGFASRSLPGYSFVYERPMKAGGVVISPDFIRSKNSELDQFYVSLTGYSLGTYFHFIVKQINVDDASREMIAQPQIL